MGGGDGAAAAVVIRVHRGNGAVAARGGGNGAVADGGRVTVLRPWGRCRCRRGRNEGAAAMVTMKVLLQLPWPVLPQCGGSNNVVMDVGPVWCCRGHEGDDNAATAVGGRGQ